MKKHLLVFGLCLMASVAHADSTLVPDDALDTDYKACMGGNTPDPDPQRKEYCLCIRDSMKNWTVDEYAETALQGAKAPHDAEHQPPKLQDVAKACIDKVLK